MKKLIVVLGLFCAMPVMADNEVSDDGSGFIVGIDAGSAKIDYQPYSYNSYIPNYTVAAYDVSHRSGFAGDGYIGYLLYKQFGWELAYTGYQTADFSYNASPNSMKVKRYDYDVLMRGDYPFTTNLSGFVKAGVARVNSRLETTTGFSSNIVAWTPVYGLGVAYNITDHTELNTQWLHTQKVNPNAHTGDTYTPDVPSTNYYSLGWRYRF